MSLATLRARNRSLRPPRRIPRWIVVIAALTMLGVLLTVFGSRSLEVYRLGREAARLAAVKRTLQQENAVLREEMKLLQTPGYIEKIAREQLGLVKPGEIAVLIVHPPPPTPKPAPASLKQDRVSLAGRAIRALKRVLKP